jgi:hypothetical protein
VPTLEYRRPRPAPLLYAVGPWEITVSSAAGSLVKRPHWILTYFKYAARALRIVLGRGLPTVKIFHSRYSKKLARAAYIFNRGLGQRVKTFLLRTNVDINIRSFQKVDRKHFNTVAAYI